jgi:cardiolipin synthase (CMP-forming)
MGLYRRGELFLAPNLVSLVRLPLAALFPLSVGHPGAALAVLGAAAVSDMADGWWARRRHQATTTGAVLDGFTDKIFVGSVLLTLLAVGRLTPVEVGLLLAREIGEAPLALWRAARRGSLARPRLGVRANRYGKVATSLQFVTLAIVAAGWSPGPLLVLTAVAGAIAALSYWHREVTGDRTAAMRAGGAR